jgi:hypothetical protein
VLCTSLERDGALAEIGHRLALEPVWPSRVVHELHALTIHAGRAARLPDLPTLQTLGVNTARYEKYDYSATQAIAAAAQFLEFDALIVPNARYPGLNLVGLLENLDPNADIKIDPSEIVDWSDWRRRVQAQLRAASSQQGGPPEEARPPWLDWSNFWSFAVLLRLGIAGAFRDTPNRTLRALPLATVRARLRAADFPTHKAAPRFRTSRTAGRRMWKLGAAPTLADKGQRGAKHGAH